MESLLAQAITIGLLVGVGIGLVVGWLIHEVSGCGRARTVGYRR